MHSSLIGKIEKAKRYAQEPERITVRRLHVDFRGDNDAHPITYDGVWHCSCGSYQRTGACAHVSALCRVLGPIAPEEDHAEMAVSGYHGLPSSLIGKIEKARRYAQEPERMTVRIFDVDFRGDNDAHIVGYSDGAWNCPCLYFQRAGTCSHVMALQRLLGPISPEDRTVDISQPPPRPVEEAVASA